MLRLMQGFKRSASSAASMNKQEGVHLKRSSNGISSRKLNTEKAVLGRETSDHSHQVGSVFNHQLQIKLLPLNKLLRVYRGIL